LALNMTRGLRIYLAILLAGILLAGSAFPTIPPPARALSAEEEKKLGEKFLKEIKSHFPVVEDPFARRYINELGRYLARPVETKYFRFRFYLINDETLNAFAGPGGHIFVFSGLITALDNVDELAAVICHEIAHVSARHLSRRIEQNKKIGLATLAGVLAGVLIGGKAAGAVITSSLAGGIQAQLHYSRKDERQADQLGFRYMSRSGFRPSAMIDALKKIEQGQWFGTERMPPYLLTHPTGPERMANLDSLVMEEQPAIHDNPEARRFRDLFPYLQTFLRATAEDDFNAEKAFIRDLEKDPASPYPSLGLGIIYLDRADVDSALVQLEEAHKKDPGSPLILKYLGMAYQMKGRDREAIPVFERLAEADIQDRESRYLLALSRENIEEYEKAADVLERLAHRPPVRPEVFYHLGICYGRTGRLAVAHYNFGRYFKKLGERKKARFHFNKARKLAGDDQELIKKIEEARKKKGRIRS